MSNGKTEGEKEINYYYFNKHEAILAFTSSALANLYMKTF